jgi:glutathione S-transferase
VVFALFLLLLRYPALIAMAKFTLCGHFASPPTYKAVLALRLTSTPFDYIHIDLSKGEQKEEAHMSRSGGFGLLPVLEDRERNTTIMESAVIVDYIAQQAGMFLGDDENEKWAARAWQSWSVSEIFTPIYLTVLHNLGIRKLDDAVVKYWKEKGVAGLSKLEALLAGKTWLVGDKPTIADIELGAIVHYTDEAKFELEPYPSVVAWKARFEALPGFASKDCCVPRENKSL